jgi:D-alanine-D-alanine ligase
MEASGIPYRDLLGRLIDLAVLRHQEKTAKTRFFQSGSQWFA